MPDITDPGYCRIGSVVLQIPPTDITTNKIVNDDQIATLRSGTPMFIKSGQARWDVTMRWKAVRGVNGDGSFDYSQWKDLRRVIATFKASPFVEVENDFLRQHFTDIQAAYKKQRMAFALKQIRVETNPDTSNVIDVTLTMSLFNFSPFSTDFAYTGGDSNDDPVDAIDSAAYNFFINHWMSVNMDNSQHSKGEPDLQPWDDQEEGTLSFKWRKYLYVPFTTPPPQSVSRASAGYSPTTPTPQVPTGQSKKRLSDDIQQIVNRKAKQYGLDPAIVTAQCLYESGGRPNAISPTGAIGLFQLLPSTARALGVADPFDPEQNVDGGCRYLRDQLRTFKNYPHALGAYNAGPGYIYAFRDGRPIKNKKTGYIINPEGQKTADGLPPAGTPHNENVPKYVQIILTNAEKQRLIVTEPPRGSAITPPPTKTDTSALDIPNQGILDLVSKAIQNLPPADQENQWLLDHYTELGAYFYQEEETFLAPADASSESDYDLFPNQISVVMVNNLPVLPLAGMQYPTFQHVGPTDTMISISMNSVGIDGDVLTEPEHPGIQALSAMSSQLEDQFHKLRTHFRAISSIHRMQAVFIENQILNMLGIRGTMLRGLNTETIPDSSNLVQVSVMASQYENIFEDTPPYRINGLPSAYKGTLQNILKGGDLDKASLAEQQAFAVVKEFGDAWQKRDEQFLLKEILSISREKIDFLSNVSTIDAGLRPDQKTFVLGNLDLPEFGNGQTAAGVISTVAKTFLVRDLGVGGTGNQTFQRDTWPGLSLRKQALTSSSAGMTYADYFVFTQLPEISDSTVNSAIRSATEAKFSNQKSAIVDSMYLSLFDFELLTNPLFSRQATAIANSPAFKALFNDAVSVDGPSLQPGNEGHFCYKDLGLTDYRQNPADYFMNHNELLRTSVTGSLDKILAESSLAADTVNNSLVADAQKARAAGQFEHAQHLEDSATKGFVFSGDGQGIPGDSKALSRMVNIPAYSLNSAFPTFKLMLIEEDNTGPFFAFDNFYSYASVIDIEVIKYMDKPDTAVIQITNLAHALNHRLFDDTAAGKLESDDDRFNIAQDGSLVAGGPNVAVNEVGTGGSSAGSIIASKVARGTPYQKKNLTEGRGETYSRVPLKFFALQTGAKVQVRMGYSNNPDNLFPVFTGQVTEIEGEDILTLTCQSFMLELMNVPGTVVAADTRLGFNFLTGGAALGGYSLSNAGDTGSVIGKMLTSEAARHFGFWQIGGLVDPMLKGFTWTDFGGKLLSGVSNPTVAKVASLLQTGYDRSKENILINSTINYDATKKPDDPANAGRRQFDENTSWVQSYLRIGTPTFSIPKQSELSVWDIIKDVSRRYPHYNLMVRDYGFPYGADATMVYAHPLDWYYYRPPLYGDAEKEKANNVTQGQKFQQWWTSIGKAKWDEIWNHAFDGRSFVLGLGLNAALSIARKGMDSMAASGPEGFVSAIQQAHGILTGTTQVPPANSALDTFFNGLQHIQNIFDHLATEGNLTQGFYQNLDGNFQALLREWERYLVLSDPAANSSRLRPVRKYHLIDYNHIIHNSIRVDDNIYNAVKIMDESPYKFNQNIPGQYTRVLNATSLINNPQENCSNADMKRVYAQSFLREEVGKMYRGELVLRGVPEIEPFDVILLHDISTGMIGPIEVESVIHSFNLENGYITIVKPRLMVIANESVSMNANRALGFAWANGMAELHGLEHVFRPFGPESTISGDISGVIGGLAIAGAIAVGIWVAPLGILAASLSLLAGYGLITWVDNQQNINFFKLQPLSRFGRPWVGGLQGFKTSDFAYSVMNGLKHFDAEEIAPTIESWNEFLHYRADYINGT